METLESGRAFRFRTASVTMDIPFVRCTEEVSYERRLATLLPTWRRDKFVPTIRKVVFPCHDKDWSLLWLMTRRWYWVCERHF